MKLKVKYVCSNCGYESAKWLGKCTSCNSWDSFQEVQEEGKHTRKLNLEKKSNIKVYKLSEIETGDEYRYKTGIGEFDRVLGGGVVPGSFVLIAGAPGIGKSTLALQMTKYLMDRKPLYISGEESLSQIKHRAERLSDIPAELNLLSETDLNKIVDAINTDECQLAIVDSIQSVYLSDIESTPGSFNQVRECTAKLMQVAKRLNKPIFIIGHINKEGSIAGPKILEHMVDTVLQFEGSKGHNYRILRAIKNRYGSTNEIGVFEMYEKGLKEVTNPSEYFLSESTENEAGTITVASTEGNRPILVEVQTLVSPTSFSVPQRTATGFDNRRLQMILAVLEKKLGTMFFKYDVFLNIAGGLKVNDTSTDLGIALSLISSLNNEPLKRDIIVIGEIGLTGEVRSVFGLLDKIKEAEKLGFSKAIIPNIKNFNYDSKGIELVKVSKIEDALTKLNI
jgi:DNA repair protein RadA/Sms